MGDEGSSSKLDNLSRDDLVKLVKKYIILNKQLRAKSEDLAKQVESKTCNNNQANINNADVLKDLNQRIDELTKSNGQLNDENCVLKEKIKSLNDEIEILKSNLEEHKSFRLEFEPQLENAQREITLNKSMLEMLNNEIKLLNSEKVHLEKRLYNRRIGTPSVIVEEDEEDLEAEKRGEDYSNNELDSIMEEEHDFNEAETIENYKKEEYDKDIDYLHKSKVESGQVMALSKQLEDITFYLDELKIELESEKEKNGEYASEIENLKKKFPEANCPNEATADNSVRFEKFLNHVKNSFDENEREFGADMNELEKQIMERVKTKMDEIRIERENRKYFENQLEKVIQNNRKELEELETNVEFLTKSKQGLEAKIKSVENELENERQNFKKYEKEVSKSKVLNLEIADYEKSIKTLNSQIALKDKEIADLKQEIILGKENVAKLNQNVERLERERDDEKDKVIKLQQTLVKAKKDINEAKAHETDHLNNEAMLNAKLEQANQDIEYYKIQIAELGSEKQRLQEKLQSTSDTYSRSNHLLESKNQTYQEEIENLKQKLNTVQNEYENYKIKAQQAFRKQKEQSAPGTQVLTEAELQKCFQDNEQLKLLNTKLNEKLDENLEKLKILEKESEITQEEYSRVLDRYTKLLNELKDKEIAWKSRLEELEKHSFNKVEESQQLIRNLKIENEALVAQHKEKIRNLNNQHLHTVDSLQVKLDDSRREIERLNKVLQELRNKSPSPGNITPNSSFLQAHSRTDSGQMNNLAKNNFILGMDASQISEKLDNEENKNSLLTLEQLLNEPSLAHTEPSDSKVLISQISQLKNDLTKAKLQLDHLNELLNESELNNARLNEQINLLKEEIRRLERNQEREKSISNMEYLKNVVCKFLTLSTTQEKFQLLPVLTTMLKLNQEEQNAIMNFAKNNHSEKDSQNTGWTTFLPKWST